VRSVGYVKLGNDDNIAVLTEEGLAGDFIDPDSGRVVLVGDVPAGHKIAVEGIPEDGKIIKYGHVIGYSTAPIGKGEWVHTSNVKSGLGVEWTPRWNGGKVDFHEEGADLSFMGYPRRDGRYGVRNDLWIIPTVGCINGLLQSEARRYPLPPWITDIKVLAHPYGCSQLGGDLDMTTKLLCGLAKNPNAAGVAVVGLGCENLTMDRLSGPLNARENVEFIVLQEERDDIEAVGGILDHLAEKAPRDRIEALLSELTIGVKCGGSDSFSSLTSNPLLGRVSDLLVASGGTVLATEIPEMFGAEDMITSRITERDVFDKFTTMIDWFKNYFVSYDQPVYENPSPGNKAGGITTLEEKSLGAVTKSGHGPVTDVLPYGTQSSRRGVNILFSPGNDLVSSTSLAAGGAQIVAFTTGRGTPFGTVVPTLKISSNTRLFENKRSWIDFDAGKVLGSGEWDRERDRLMKLILEIASGRKTKSEERSIAEIAIFKDGVIL